MSEATNAILSRDAMDRMREAAASQAKAYTRLSWIIGVSTGLLLSGLLALGGYVAGAVGELRARHETALTTAIAQADEGRRAMLRIEKKLDAARKSAAGAAHGQDR